MTHGNLAETFISNEGAPHGVKSIAHLLSRFTQHGDFENFTPHYIREVVTDASNVIIFLVDLDMTQQGIKKPYPEG